MSVLQKLKDIKRVLDRNLNTRSGDILPVINECIKELEESIEKPVKTVDKKEIKQEESKEVIEVKEEIEIVPSKEPIIDTNKDILVQRYIDKYGKKPFGGRSIEVLQSKLI